MARLALALAAQEAQEVERGLVALFLGGGGQVDLSGFPSRPSLQQAESELGSGFGSGAAADELQSKPAGQGPESVAGELQQQQQPRPSMHLTHTV